MSGVRYRATITGEPLAGFDINQVKEEFAKTFTLSLDKVEALFGSPGKVIKKELSPPKSERFMQILTKIGAEATIVDELGNVIQDNIVRFDQQGTLDELDEPMNASNDFDELDYDENAMESYDPAGGEHASRWNPLTYLKRVFAQSRSH